MEKRVQELRTQCGNLLLEVARAKVEYSLNFPTQEDKERGQHFKQYQALCNLENHLNQALHGSIR